MDNGRGSGYWRSAAKLGVWAVARAKKVWNNLKKGDKIIAYASRRVCGFCGAFRATSNAYYDDTSQLFGLDPQKYRYRVKISAELIPERPVDIRPLINELSFIKDPDIWGTYFQHSVRKISENDFNKILSHIKRVGQFETDQIV